MSDAVPYLPSPDGPGYHLLFVPDVGRPVYARHETEESLLAHMGSPREAGGWLFAFWGDRLMVIPGGHGFVTQTGRVVLAEPIPDNTPDPGGQFVPAAPQSTDGRVIES